MGTRAYRRDKRGRFAGSGGGTVVTYGKAGGFAHAGFRGRVMGQRASGSKSLGGAAGAKGPAKRPAPPRGHAGKSSHLGTKAKGFAKKHEKVIIGGAVVGVAAVGGTVAYNKINPKTNLSKAAIPVPGAITAYGGKKGSPETTIVENATHRFLTTTQGKGLKATNVTYVQKKTGKTGTGAGQPIGYVLSRKGVTGTNLVTHTYLTKSNRGKGLGTQALAAHAAHRPSQSFRADPSRSISGQALAKSVGVAGRRSSASKKSPLANTKTLDYDWRTNTSGVAKGSITNLRSMAKSTKGTKIVIPVKRKIAGKKVHR